MKRIFLIFIVLFILLSVFNFNCVATDFQDESDTLWSSLDDQTKEYLYELGINEISLDDLYEITPLRTIQFLIKTVTTTGNDIAEKVILIVVVLIITSIALSFIDGSNSITKIINFVSSLIIISVVIISFVRILNDAIAAIKTTCIFVDAYLPIMCAVIIATRNPAMAFT